MVSEMIKKYEIVIKGYLDQRWQKVFPDFEFNFELRYENEPVTRMIGDVKDQSALNGFVNHLWKLGIELISIQELDHEN